MQSPFCVRLFSLWAEDCRRVYPENDLYEVDYELQITNWLNRVTLLLLCFTKGRSNNF